MYNAAKIYKKNKNLQKLLIYFSAKQRFIDLDLVPLSAKQKQYEEIPTNDNARSGYTELLCTKG
jgi:hypothetical protein